MKVNSPLRRQRIVFLSLTFALCVGVFSFFSLNIIQAQFEDNLTESPLAESAPAAFVDSGFNPIISGINGQWVKTIVQPDGKILAAGEVKIVNGVNRNSLARFNTDGSLDMTFNTGSGADNAIFGMDLQPDGKILVSGLFTNFNGVAVGRIARLNANGSLDQTFNTTGIGFNPNSGANQEISCVEVLADGRIMIGGAFSNYNGIAQNRLARLNADGSLDTTFTIGTGPNNTVLTMDAQTDGKIIIGGNFALYNTVPTGRIARINTDGSRDTSFLTGTGAPEEIRDIVIQPDGNVIVAGFFTSFNGVAKNGITRLKTDGTNDDMFSVAGLDAVVLGVALQPDGKIIVGGSFTAIAGTTHQCLARLNANGTDDTTFNPVTGIGAQLVNDIALQPDGKAVVVGSFSTYTGTPNGGVIRINPNGALDINLASSSANFGTVQAMAVQADGKIIIGGTFTRVNGTAHANIARLNADGSLDTTFNPGSGTNITVNSVAIQSDGKVLIGGGFTTVNGTAINRIARLNSDGSLDTGFAVGTGTTTNVLAIKVQPSDGKIVIGGNFTTYNGATVNRFARLNTDGSLDTSFMTGTSSNGEVRSIVFQPDGKILIGGTLTNYNGTARNRVARINADGTLDLTFNPGTGLGGPVTSVGLQTDGKVVVGGNFTTANGLGRNRIARFNMDGSLDAAFNPGIGPGTGTATEVTQVLPVANGKTLIAGNFTFFNNLPRNRITRLNADGSMDGTFLNGIGAVNSSAGLAVRSLAQQPDGKILIGGQFAIFNVSARTGIARFSNATDTFADFDGDGKTDYGIIRRPGVIGAWTWWISNSSNGAISTFNFGLSPRDVPQPHDFDGDGKDDVAMYRTTPLAGEVPAYYIIHSATNTLRVIPFGLTGDVPLTEDYDGDGKDDLSVWRVNTAAQGAGQATWFYLGSLNNPNNNITYVQWGMRYGTQSDQVDDPYPGDMDGDGRADFTVQRRTDITVPSLSTPATFHTLTATGNITYVNDFGLMGDRILPGDYDGDGRTDIAVCRGFNISPGNTTWYIRYSSGIPDYQTVFGRGFNFAQGDYDGDGKTDIGYFIPGTSNDDTGFWWISSVNGATNFFRWGALGMGAGAGDLPIAGYNNR